MIHTSVLVFDSSDSSNPFPGEDLLDGHEILTHDKNHVLPEGIQKEHNRHPNTVAA